jgi:hypothetical protein
MQTLMTVAESAAQKTNETLPREDSERKAACLCETLAENPHNDIPGNKFGTGDHAKKRLVFEIKL